MTDKNIIVACPFVAGIASYGMYAIKKELGNIPTKRLNKIDSLNTDFRTPKRVRTNNKGIRYENELDGGEISLFDELEVSL